MNVKLVKAAHSEPVDKSLLYRRLRAKNGSLHFGKLHFARNKGKENKAEKSSSEFSRMHVKKSLLERLDAGEVIIGDGGMIFNLERRGYVHAGRFTPEVVLEYPEAVRQLHREYVHSGADVLQALTFFASDSHLQKAGIRGTCREMNDAACKIAKEVAEESSRDVLVAGCLSETFAYTGPDSKEDSAAEFAVQVKCFIENDVDFVVAEYFRYIEEMCWAIEALRKANKPIVAMMNIGGMGDRNGVSTGDCAVEMAKWGADVIGLNCCFGPELLVEAMKDVKDALEKAGLKKHLICQPLGFLTPDAGKDGYLGLPEFPFALEPRSLTRFDARKFARNAYEAGVKYIGGCCNFEAYHIREMAAELAKERGFKAPNADKMSDWGTAVASSPTPWIKQRGRREYWENLLPTTGRPFSSGMSKSQYDPEWRSKNGLPR
ncbi:S-methylmethionine--homocysteine S-methyltransferase BHMT2-like isoform X1 [Rhopilema esculentum]|uniref:S-methylmethionine--homocysteine S-methyltransferase BHMT2-like isoform X1 n=1 Tax=Rhopilema esculentum TaxID=499914 RepID=UPI0031CF69FF